MTFSDHAAGRQNYFDHVRLVAALGVVLSHTFPLTGHPEPLAAITGGRVDLGALCVSVFLVISGWLITQSADRRPDLWRFVRARLLRIMPGLVVVLVFTAFLLGPLVSTQTGYLRASEPYWYVLKNVALYWKANALPGVFAANPLPDVVNGSLWTLYYEVTFYGVIAMLMVTRLQRGWMAIAVVLALGFVYWYGPIPYVGRRFAFWSRLYLPFGVGMVMYYLRTQIPISAALATGSAIGLAVSALTGIAWWWFSPVAIGYLVLSAGLTPAATPLRWDLSYGVYIYAFPIQQLVASLGVRHPALHLLVSVPPTLALAWLSWRYVETPALRLVRRQTSDAHGRDRDVRARRADELASPRPLS